MTKAKKPTPEQQANDKLLELLNTRVLIAKRFAKPHWDLVKKWEKDYNITTIADAKFDNLDNQIQIPYIFNTVESNQANAFEQFPNIYMKQRGVEDRDFTDFAGQVWDYLKDKLGLEEITEDAAMLFFNNGQSTTRFGWDPGYVEVDQPVTDPTTGQPIVDPATGQPQTQKVTVAAKNMPYVCLVEDSSIMFSPESKFVLDDEHNVIPYAVWIQKLTKEQGEEYYQTTVDEDELESIDVDELDKRNDMGGSTTQSQDVQITNDLKRVKVYNYVGMLPKDILPPDLQATYRADSVYYVPFSKKKMFATPMEISKKPILNLGNYGLPSKFWRFGEAKVLRELEQDVSLARSRIMDLRDRQGSKVAIPQGTEFDEASFKKSRDYTFLRYMGPNPPQYINPPPIPDTIIASINMSRDDIQMASATMDISRGGMDNTVNTATGQKIFSGETNKRNGKKRKKIARYFKALAKNLLILCGQNWDEQKFSKITDIPVETIQQQGWKQKLAELGEDYDVEIDVDSMNDTRDEDAANALALFREMKDRQNINQDELTKFVLKVGFRQKDATRFLTSNVTPDMILQVLQHLAQTQVLTPEDISMIATKLDEQNAPGPTGQGAPGAGGTTPPQPGPTGQNEGRPPINSPVDIMKKSMPGSDPTQMQAQGAAAYKQTGVPKGPQMNRRG